MNRSILAALAVLVFSIALNAQENTNQNKFRQLYTELPTPNVYRTASGAPGHKYWQQQADYIIDIELNENDHSIKGQETVTYYNNSPDPLEYLWLQLDQNRRAMESDSYKISQKSIPDSMSFKSFMNLEPWFDGGFKIEWVQDVQGKDLSYTINKTLMRVDMAQPLLPGKSYSFKIKWSYNINDRMKIGGRSGYEYFEDEDNAIYTIAQFYPRMAVYSDNEGWQNKQFLGRGEFTLTFGNFDVKITVPADHVVASTGELQNSRSVMTSEQLERFKKARTADKPVEIITQIEAEENEKEKASGTKTWHYKAENVRDFAFASSRKFIWDACGVPFGDRTVMAMSYYPKEANPLWGKYSTEAVMQTLETYSHHTFDYPYPVAISVNAASIGMEYPMICFNYGRCEEDGTYTERTKYGVISVIIHEVGHNYFPMIINSDERQWTWMDEGLNTFLQYLTEQQFQRGYPSRRGEPRKIVDYMKGDKSKISPIMTNSESIYQFGNNAYGKPATALNILRETVMGRELFDFAFKTYAQRWMFKHPSPADFFRTMEDASAVDLDWFWRGWFFTNDHVDISLDQVKYFQMAPAEAGSDKIVAAESKENAHPSISEIRNQNDIAETRVERDQTLVDFYTTYDANSVDKIDQVRYERSRTNYSEKEQEMLLDEKHYYELKFSNVGGLVMPVILEFEFVDGTKEIAHIPAEIWKMDDTTVTKVFVFDQQLENVVLDPYLQTADVNLDNNSWPPSPVVSRFKLYKQKKYKRENPMQRAMRIQNSDAESKLK